MFSFSHQAFLFRSWASVRVMTAEQRAALLELVARRDPSAKLSYRECDKIAKDLNLTLEQVILLFVYSTTQCLKSQLETNKFLGSKQILQRDDRFFYLFIYP